MGVGIGHLSAQDYTMHVTNDEQNFVSDDLILMRNGSMVRLVGELGKPYRIEEGRLLRITSGRGVYQINMVDYVLEAFTVVVIPPGSLITTKSMSDDYNLQAISFSGLGGDFSMSEVWLMRLGNADWQRLSVYVSLLWSVIHSPGFQMSTVRYVQMAMFDDLRHIKDMSKVEETATPPTRVQRNFAEFVRLVNEYGAREHRIAFYAGKLFLTPNRLSTLVKEQSGETAMQWIDRAVILEAKVLLRHSDLKIYEIAERLNFPNASFFNRFFRKHTGQTPLEYRES